MLEIQYIGENLLPGRLGNLAVQLGFVSALLAAFSYFKATQKNDLTWKTLGRGSFLLNSASILLVIGLIFHMMIQQYYEYQYVQTHVSDELPIKYIFSAFWEGQEGSFLLWAFWHVVLGTVVLLKGKDWESPVLAVLSLVQAFIISMLLGVYLPGGETKIGSNPFVLLRDVVDAPIFSKADYLTLIKGNGLNPLLQNYWMTIHPPTLFLGFASVTMPFAFAVAGLWTGKHREWIQPAIRWSLFSGAILGLGILMGGAWAYEALSFGGYWAWDPVENMSLVPWLILIAGIHTLLIAQSSGHSIRSSYLYLILSFVLVLYSTFLTRSGVLGDTSVHAFTEMGLEWQLVLFMSTFTIIGLGLFFARFRQIPNPVKEEPLASREFWMFIGTLVLLFSSILITFTTSIPVYNKILDGIGSLTGNDFSSWHRTAPTEPVGHHNKYQLWIGVFIGLLSGISQYLRFRAANWEHYARKFYLRTGGALALSALMTFLTTFWIKTYSWPYTLLLFSGWFTLITNLDYLLTFIKGNIRLAGSALSHLGFGVMIIGIIGSGLNKRYVSVNPFAMRGILESEEQLNRNILLVKNTPLFMGGYEVAYVHDTLEGYNRTYTVNFKRKDDSGKILEDFNLYPNVIYDKSFTKIAASNPSTKRYLGRDIFTHIAWLDPSEMDLTQKASADDSLHFRPYAAPLGNTIAVLDTIKPRDLDTFLVEPLQLKVTGIDRKPQHPEYQAEKGDIAIGADLMLHSNNSGNTYEASAVLVLRGQMLFSYPATFNELGVKARLQPEILEELFAEDQDINYQEFELRQGESFSIGSYQGRFAGFNRQPNHPNYVPDSSDIAVSALLEFTGNNGEPYRAEPVYLIRGNRPFNLKDEIPALGLHFRFISLDPGKESLHLMAGAGTSGALQVPLEVATDFQRTDLIVLEAIEFPGINLFWLGSLLMLAGLALSLLRKHGAAFVAA